MKKTIDIQNYEDFLNAGFIECGKCGWAFDPDHFKDHKCYDMNPKGITDESTLMPTNGETKK